MKTFAALTAAAALIASVSFANAASNNLTGTTNGQFCAHLKATGSTDCRFATMAECEKATKESGNCVANTNKSAAGENMKMKSTTTGSGTMNSTKSSADTNKTEQKSK